MLFWEFAWESSFLVLLVLGIRKIFMGKVRHAAICMLWFLVLFRFLIPVNVISTPFSAGTILSRVFPQQGNLSAPGYEAGRPMENPPIHMQETMAFSTDRMTPDLGSTEMGGRYGAAVLPHKGDAQPVQLPLFLAGGWAAMSVLLFLWLVLSNLSLSRKLKRNRRVYGVRNGLKIYMSPGIQHPCLYGFFHPAVYLPEYLARDPAAAGMDEEAMEQLILHEYVHYRHGDHVWAMFRVFLVSVYWFDPFLWLAIFYSKKDAEMFCDETVIRLLGTERRFDYGKMLVRLAGAPCWGDFRYPIIPVSRKGREMEQRILAISVEHRHSRRAALLLSLLALGLAVVTCSAARQAPAGDRATSGNAGSLAGNMTISSDANRINATFVGQSGKYVPTDAIPPLFGMIPATDAQGSMKVKVSLNDGTSDAGVLEETFRQYVEIFTYAVNTGVTDRMGEVLLEGSNAYGQQCEIAQNYYRRKIREKIMSCSITSARIMPTGQAEIRSREKIKCYYADAPSRVIRQKYRYVCEYANGRWMITEMYEIEG